jgi:hypothetical protein
MIGQIFKLLLYEGHQLKKQKGGMSLGGEQFQHEVRTDKKIQGNVKSHST